MKRRILIVEDQIDLLSMFSLQAEHSGLQCFAETTGVRFLEVLEKCKPEVVILDLDLPDISGIELLVQLRDTDEYKDLPIIVYSAFSDPDLVLETIKLGANIFFVKSGDIHDLLDIVNNFLNEQQEPKNLGLEQDEYNGDNMNHSV